MEIQQVIKMFQLRKTQVMMKKESQVSETLCFYRGTHELTSKYLSRLMSNSGEKIFLLIFFNLICFFF